MYEQIKQRIIEEYAEIKECDAIEIDDVFNHIKYDYIAKAYSIGVIKAKEFSRLYRFNAAQANKTIERLLTRKGGARNNDTKRKNGF